MGHPSWGIPVLAGAVGETMISPGVEWVRRKPVMGRRSPEVGVFGMVVAVAVVVGEGKRPGCEGGWMVGRSGDLMVGEVRSTRV